MIVLAAFLMLVLAAMAALAVDTGVILLSRNQSQVSADAGALAGCWGLLTKAQESTNPWGADAIDNANRVAKSYVYHNIVFSKHPTIELNTSNQVDGDIVLGAMSPTGDFLPGGPPADYNAIRIRVSRTALANGEVPLFFAPVLGWRSLPVSAEAVACLTTKVIGFRVPDDESNLPILPITATESDWDELMASGSSGDDDDDDDEDDDDDWAWDPNSQTVSQGSDGVPETQLYPQTTDAAGNFGTVNIGTSDNSTSHLYDQILNGVSPADLAFHGGELKLNGSGTLPLAGNPGISASVKAALEQIVGQARIIPLYRQVEGDGAGATYQIVRWVGIRIMSVELSGGDKRLVIQPANVVTNGTIAGSSNTSQHVFSRPRLAQ
ncbi:MAG: TadG family pilus assembly protein [Pirellulales bacterium]